MIKPPTTFTQRGRLIATVMDKKSGRQLPLDLREHIALILAMRHQTHREAVESILAHGLAMDAAEADALIRSAEDRE